MDGLIDWLIDCIRAAAETLWMASAARYNVSV